MGIPPPWPCSASFARKSITIAWMFAPWTICMAQAAKNLKSGPEDGKCVKFRPDPWMYVVGWIFILLCLTASWYILAQTKDLSAFSVMAILFFLIIATAILWMWRYHIKKLEGISIFIILLFQLVMLLPIAHSTSVYGVSLLMPLVVWVIFQLIVSAREMENIGDDPTQCVRS